MAAAVFASPRSPFAVDAHRAIAQIGGAGAQHIVVDNHQLRVQIDALVLGQGGDFRRWLGGQKPVTDRESPADAHDFAEFARGAAIAWQEPAARWFMPNAT
ncbi:hypothetical protein [Accumulibacter sp.]|uniref:hypothetical protein n=1 Tax=Accumulibacter sp. TaxID=2053492 RepID=UPI0028C46408|nr:hypothetical protein [Accumulibacter sp.]